MQATIMRNGKEYTLSSMEMYEAARCLRINFMQNELETEFNVPESESDCEGKVDRTEYDCIYEIVNKYGF